MSTTTPTSIHRAPAAPRRRASAAAALVLACLVLAALAAAAGAAPYSGIRNYSEVGGGVMRQPQGVAFDRAGNVLVADRWSYLVQRFSPDGTWLGQFGSYGSRRHEFGVVGGIDTDASGALYLFDITNERITKFAAGGRYRASWGAQGVVERGEKPKQRHPFDIRFKGGLAVGPDAVYVTDTFNHRVLKYSLEGKFLDELGKRRRRGSTRGRFWYPQGLDVDASGNLYVADNRNHRIQKFSPRGTYLGQIYGGPKGSLPGQLAHPYDVDVDAAGFVYVADNHNHRISVFDPSFAFVRTIGTPNPNQQPADEEGEPGEAPPPDADAAGEETRPTTRDNAAPGRLNHPRALAVAPSGNVFVADTVNDRMQRFDPSGQPTAVWGRSGREHGNLVGPHGLDFDPDGNMVVVDSFEEWVQRLDPATGGVVNKWGGHTGLNLPQDVLVDRTGVSHVTDPGKNRVKRYDRDGNLLGIVSGLRRANGITQDEAGNFFVAEQAANRLRKLGPELRTLGRFGSRGPREARLRAPSGVALDGSCSAFVADTGNDRVAQYRTFDGEFVRAIGRRGRGRGQLLAPRGVEVDGAGQVFVADSGNARVQRFSSSGAPRAAWGRRGRGRGRFIEPVGIRADGRGSLYVSDPYNNNIQRFDRATSAGAPPRPTALRVSTAVRAPSIQEALKRGIPVSVRSAGACAATSTAFVPAPLAPQLGLGDGTQPVQVGAGSENLVRGRGVVTVRIDRRFARRLARADTLTLDIVTTSVADQVDLTSPAATRTVTLRAEEERPPPAD